METRPIKKETANARDFNSLQPKKQNNVDDDDEFDNDYPDQDDNDEDEWDDDYDKAADDENTEYDEDDAEIDDDEWDNTSDVQSSTDTHENDSRFDRPSANANPLNNTTDDTGKIPVTNSESKGGNTSQE